MYEDETKDRLKFAFGAVCGLSLSLTGAIIGGKIIHPALFNSVAATFPHSSAFGTYSALVIIPILKFLKTDFVKIDFQIHKGIFIGGAAGVGLALFGVGHDLPVPAVLGTQSVFQNRLPELQQIEDMPSEAFAIKDPATGNKLALSYP